VRRALGGGGSCSAVRMCSLYGFVRDGSVPKCTARLFAKRLA
jgi:hypothetical protein